MYYRLFRRVAVPSLACLCAVVLALSCVAETAARTSPPEGNVSYRLYVLERLARASGSDADIRLASGPVKLAVAMIIDDQEVILYNPRSFDHLEQRTGTAWAAVSVIAHEMGHCFYGHAEVDSTSVAQRVLLAYELEADYFSGYTLARVGATIDDAQAAQRTLNLEETASHPSSARRLRAIEAGWLDGRVGLAIAKDPSKRLSDEPLNQTLIRRLASHPEMPAPPEPLRLVAGQW
jgi:hypothetical protein